MIVAGTGPRSVVTTASYEARRFGVGLGHAGGAGAAAVPAGRVPGAGLRLLPRGVARGDGDRAVAPSSAVEVVGLDEAYLDLTGLPAPHAAMRRLAGRDRADDRPRLLDRDRPEQARRQGGLRCREAARVRGADPRAGVRAVRVLAVRAGAGHRPQDGRAAARAGRRDAGRARRRRPGERLAARFGPRLAAELQRRARFEDDSPVTEERKVVSESRELTFDQDIRDPRTARGDPGPAGRAAVRGPRSPSGAAGGRSASRSASTTSPPTPGPARCPRPVGVGRPGRSGRARASAPVRGAAPGPAAGCARGRTRTG